MMTPKARLLAALNGDEPDRLPVTTHHLMPYFLDHDLDGASNAEFFERFGLDPILWLTAVKPDLAKGQYLVAGEVPRVASPDCRITQEDLAAGEYRATRVDYATPVKTLSMVVEVNQQTGWVSERLIKQKADVDVLGDYLPVFLCDVEAVNAQIDAFGDRGLVRGMVPGFDHYGQSGCWQDAAVLYGIEQLIIETFVDPAWVHHFLGRLCDRKQQFLESMRGARLDLVEMGGGDASSTVISPTIFERFVAPYDGKLIRLARDVGQRTVYHTCGGMMPILEQIADMSPDAMETFTPEGMGGDVDLAAAKRRVGDRVCMIGGFDQFHHFKGCTQEDTRQAVRTCFDSAGAGGGYILAPSDHFFEADLALLEAFADEAHRCRYG